MKQFISKLEVVPPFDPVEAVFELPICIQKSGRESRSEVEVATHIDRHCAGGHILRHIDAEFAWVNGFRLQLV